MEEVIDLAVLLKGWVKDRKIPVDVWGNSIVFDIGKWFICTIKEDHVVLYDYRKIEAVTLHASDPEFLSKLETSILERTNALRHRSWFRRWLEDPGM